MAVHACAIFFVASMHVRDEPSRAFAESLAYTYSILVSHLLLVTTLDAACSCASFSFHGRSDNSDSDMP